MRSFCRICRGSCIKWSRSKWCQ